MLSLSPGLNYGNNISLSVRYEILDPVKASLNVGNTIQAINARAVSIIRYLAGILEWRKSELEAIDRKTRKGVGQMQKGYIGRGKMVERS